MNDPIYFVPGLDPEAKTAHRRPRRRDGRPF